MQLCSPSKRILIGLALAAGCGRVGYEDLREQPLGDAMSSLDGAVDADIVADASADGSASAPRCDWSAGPPDFGAIEHLELVSSTSADFDPTLSHDGTTLYFASRRDGDENIFRSTREGTSAAFVSVSSYDEVNSAVEDTRFFLRADGLEAFLVSLRSGTLGVADIFRSTRASTSIQFGSFASLPLVSSTGDEFDPFLSGDGRALYFAPLGRRNGVGAQDLFVSTRASAESGFAAGEPVPNVNSASDETDASLTDDDLVILFGSNRTGTMRVYYATRGSALEPFGAPALVPQLATGIAAIDPFVSPNGCVLYFAATRADSLGQQDLYRLSAVPR